MKSFETKKALLEYLGKNPDDRRLVDRMMARGSVRHFDGMYYLIEEEDVDALVGKILEPRKVGVMADKVSDEMVIKLENEVKDLRKKLEERAVVAPKDDLYDHLVFFYERFLAWKSFVDGKVFGQSQYNNQQGKQDTMEMVQPEVYARYGFTYGEMEKAECEFVQGLINDKLDELPF